MRDIIFRGKEKRTDKWVQGSLIHREDYCCILQAEEDADPYEYTYLDEDLGTIDGIATPVIPDTVSQYIGLTDRNGTKIFEGDILESPVKHINRRLGPLILITDIRECKFISLNCSEYVVIGNIHDNPGLLKH